MSAVHISSESKQDYVTPREFIRLVEQRFGVVFWRDLAASHENARCADYWTKEDDSLSLCWHGSDVCPQDAQWLNPEYKNVTPWVKKCAEESAAGARIVRLTLSSLGSRWFRDYVQPNAMVYVLEDRVTFEGQEQPYPKELMICLWGFGLRGLGWWKWK